MRRKKRDNAIHIASGIIFICFLTGSLLYVFFTRSQNESKTLEYLSDVTSQRRLTVRQNIDYDLQILRATAVGLAEMDLSDTERTHAFISEINRGNSFIRMGFFDTSGQGSLVDMAGIIHRGITMGDTAFFQQVAAGKDAVSAPFMDTDAGERLVCCAVPVRQGGAVVGVLCGVHTETTLRNTVDMPVYKDSGFFLIVDHKGTYVIAPHNAPLAKELGEAASIFRMGDFTETERREAEEALAAQERGVFSFASDGERYVLTVHPLGTNGWSIAGVIDLATVEATYSNTVFWALVLTAAACAVILLLALGQIHSAAENNARLEVLAYTDALTGVRNYAKFLLDAEDILAENPTERFAVWTFDTKNFSNINALFGAAKGDLVLQRVARVLAADSPETAIMCRVSADMFAGLRPYRHRDELVTWFWSVIGTLAQREVISENKMRIHDAMGVYFVDEFDERPPVSSMVAKATIARAAAKDVVGNTIRFFTAEMGEIQRWKVDLEASAAAALAAGDFTFYLQPKVSLYDGYRIVGAEALARWNHRVYGFIAPDQFIPLFEENGFIVELDRYIFESVCKMYKECLTQGCAPIRVAVNVSRLGLLHDDFVPYYAEVKRRYGIEDGILELEFTESVILTDHVAFREIVLALQAEGFLCSIDDFGSGYSSLNVLKSLPIDVLKLDAVFFREGKNGDREHIVVANFLSMARELGIKTVAEGVEETAQVSFLKDSGCDMIQGYVFSKPLPQDAFQQLLRDTGGAFSLPPEPTE